MGKLQQFYDKRYNQGLCIYCGKNSHSEGMKTCQACREKRKNSNKIKGSKILNEDGMITTANGEEKNVDDVLNSSEFLMCGK